MSSAIQDAKSTADIIQKVGLPIFLSTIFSGFLIWLVFFQLKSAENDKEFQREQIEKVSDVIVANTEASVGVKSALQSLESSNEGVKTALKSLEKEIMAIRESRE